MIKKYTSQFWVGKFDSSEIFYEFMGENPEFWTDENEELENIPLSAFIASQGKKWYDHDFLESGYNDKGISLLEKFGEYSYSSQWSIPVEEKVKLLEIDNVNSFIMMGIDDMPNGKRHLQVLEPCSFKSEGIELIYIGEFSYEHDMSWLNKKSD